MPVLLLELLFFFYLGLHETTAGLNDEAHLGRDTEVRDDHKLKFLQEGLTRELVLVTVGLHEVLHANWLDLHDVADVQVEDPFILVQETENSSHVDLIAIFFLNRILANFEVSIFDISLVIFIVTIRWAISFLLFIEVFSEFLFL